MLPFPAVLQSFSLCDGRQAQGDEGKKLSGEGEVPPNNEKTASNHKVGDRDGWGPRARTNVMSSVVLKKERWVSYPRLPHSEQSFPG